MMIGVSSDVVGEIDTLPFPIGSQLIMYTDGLVERRDRPLQVGIDQAASHLAALSTHLAPREVIDSLHQALIGSKATDDDIAVLVVEHIAVASA
jgi:serine phosphatase RsbU (regulator of sigma subunit)